VIYIYPYKFASKSAKTLREGLSQALNQRVLMVRPDGKFRPRRDDTVINWGNSTFPTWHWGALRDMNGPFAVKLAANKLDSFKAFKECEVQTPDWTVSKNEAMDWLQGGATTVLCRTVLNGHSGIGIVSCSTPDLLVDAPLYVKYKKKKAEYRVHVFLGHVIDVQQKRRRDGFRENDDFNAQIRNHGNGWVYCRDNLNYDYELEGEAIKAVNALGLDFGAVDVIWNQHENRYYVLEVNTAPGLDGGTVDHYVREITDVV